MAKALNSSSLATTSILLLLHHLFLFSSPTTATTTTTTTTPPVLDSEGNQVEFGSEYYINTAVEIGFTGGLRLRSRPNFPPCPRYVFRTNIETDPGRPVEFLRFNSTGKTINVSDVIRIQFTGHSICGSTAWQLINGQNYVSAGHAAVWQVINLFKIEKMGNQDGVYKIRYTYQLLDVISGDLGILPENGTSWLGVSDEPLTVSFVKKPKQYNEVE